MSANCLKLNPEKTELLWSGSRHSLRKLGGCEPTIKLDTDTIKASDHVRLIGVIMSSDLSLEKHASVVTAAAFSISGRFVVSGSHWMRSQQQHSSMRLWLLALTVALYWLIWPCRRRSQQSCSVWWTLLPASLATLKFDCGLSRLLHDELHWLDVADRVGLLKLAVLYCWCIDVFMEQLRYIWWTVAHKQPTSPVVNICGPPVNGSWWFRVIDWSGQWIVLSVLCCWIIDGDSRKVFSDPKNRNVSHSDWFRIIFVPSNVDFCSFWLQITLPCHD